MAECSGDSEHVTTTMNAKNRRWFFIGNLPRELKAEDVIKFLSLELQWKQDLVKIEMVTDKYDRPRGHGFVSVPHDLSNHVLAFHEKDCNGRQIRVELAKASRYMKVTNNKFVEIGGGVHVCSAKQIYIPPNASQTTWPDIIDIGANLTHPSLIKDLPGLLANAQLFGVKKIIVTGTSLRASYSAQKLAKENPSLYFTAGVHPHDAKRWDDDTAKKLEKLCEDTCCVAVGETGLDFERNFSPKDVQEQVFEKQIELACRLKKPLFVHERKAFSDLVRILMIYKDQLPPTIIHCFGGTTTELETYLENGFYIGITASVFRDKSDNGPMHILQNNLLPLKKLMIETDSPFLFPNISRFLPSTAKQLYDKQPELKTKFDKMEQLLKQYCRGHRNEPCTLAVTNQIIATLMGLEPEALAKATRDNAISFFGLK